MHRRRLLAAMLTAAPLTATRVQAAAAPVVLELFTSQGCSSCPPADALLGDLVRRPNVIGLAWHVDYWNSLGWHDPFARREWTDRQRDYARLLNGEVYTPALVVNGAALMVGSDRAAVGHAIERAEPPAIAVTLRRAATGLEAEIGNAPPGVTALLAVYDPEHATAVGAGENQGRRLVEYRVVRDAVRVDRLTPRLTLPPVPDNRGAVLLLQDATGRVVGAGEVPALRGT